MTPRSQRLRVLAGYAVALAALSGTVWYLDLDWQSFWFHISEIPRLAVLLAGFMFLAHTVINAAAFGFLLRSFSKNASVRSSAVSWLSTVLTKYVPGGVWHFVSRGVLLHRSGVTKQDIFFSSLLEQAVAISAAFSIALLVVAWNSDTWLYIGIFAISMCFAALIFLGVRAKAPNVTAKPSLLAACFLYVLTMVPYAAGYVLIVQPDRLLDFLAWLFAATSGGMVAVITPGGLGVREAILSAPPGQGTGQAVFAAVIAARIAIIMAEAIASISVITFGLQRREKNGNSSEASRLIQSIGYGVTGPGYPNSRAVQKIFDSLDSWDHVNVTKWLPENIRLWSILKRPTFSGLFLLARLQIGSLLQLLLVLPNRKRLYFLPYPSIFVLWWSSWIPRKVRPRFLIDAYISIWDSAFNDRNQFFGKPRIASKLFKAYEGRAMRSAASVIVDTIANRSWMIDEFSLESKTTHAFPLSFDADPFLKLPQLNEADYEQNHFTVLFFGTLVPLQGIQIICEAIQRLKKSQRIRFLIVGDGQEAWRIEQLVAQADISNLQWIRKWSSPTELASHLSGAHLSLGVFGGAGKAERVLPWKIYIALAAGRPVLTQTVYSLPSDVDCPPLLRSEPTPESLANAILSASRQGGKLAEYANSSRVYFRENLGEANIRPRWRELLESISQDRR